MTGETMKRILALIPLAAILIAGCGKTGADVADGQATPNTGDAKTTAPDDHSGWWCAEHGVPEAECSLCNAKVAADFKKSGDWCKKHNRAESQCFLCDPSRAEKYVKLYEAKYGKKPPKPEE
jgi:hypothetical protein